MGRYDSSAAADTRAPCPNPSRCHDGSRPRLTANPLATLGLMLPSPAAAHSDLTSSTPASGATVQSAPDEVTLVSS